MIYPAKRSQGFRPSTSETPLSVHEDMPIQTDREIKANRPDIVIKDKPKNSCLLIDMSIPTEKNTSVKVTEKLSKYKDLEIEIERMWGMEATTIPVVIGALGLMKRAWRNTPNKSRVTSKLVNYRRLHC